MSEVVVKDVRRVKEVGMVQHREFQEKRILSQIQAFTDQPPQNKLKLIQSRDAGDVKGPVTPRKEK